VVSLCRVVAAPVLPLLLVLGVTEGAIETIGSTVLMAMFGVSWITIGISVTRYKRSRDTPPIS